MGRGGAGRLLDGISLAQNASLRAGDRIQYLDLEHTLLNALTGSFLTLKPGDTLYSSISAASSDWRELAYTVLHSGASNQFYTGNETFGPRWTSLMDPARAPVLLVRKIGAGEVVVAQMGRWNITAQPDMDAVRLRSAESPLARLTENVIRWAGGGAVGAAGR
jgi:hypothetical protein